AQALHAASDTGSGLSLEDSANISIVNATTSSPVTSPVSLTGTSASGAGVSTSGDVTVHGIILNGATSADNGTGVKLGGNLTIADNISGVKASSSGNGTAIVLDNVTLNASAHGDTALNINASASGDNGTAIKVTGNSTLSNTALNGQADTGAAVVIDGNLNTDQTVTGNTTDGQGVVITG
ncbi:TPA: hypothetical protein MND73_004827, partial [Salmonella enterica subsp. houtenae]|nr:hypothetical protein [Salmonella enterica subsp. houtenae]